MLQLVEVGVAGRLAPFSAQIDGGLQVHLIGQMAQGRVPCWRGWRACCRGWATSAWTDAR